VKLSQINPYKEDVFSPDNSYDVFIKKNKQNDKMVNCVSEFRKKFADYASLPKPFKVVKVSELP
jgi:hypothetical protein